MQFTIFQESLKGARRINQDRLAYTISRDALLMVVADGMGGHVGGEIAAQIAVRLLVERFQAEAKPTLPDPVEFLRDSLRRAHRALGAYTRRFSLVESPRTTCVCCVVQEGVAYWANVGDSRLYLFRGGKLLSRTRDHSKVQFLIEQGQLSEAEALVHPDRNKVFSCLGGTIEPVIDVSRPRPLRTADVMVLCTDGLWAMVPKERMGSALADGPVLSVGPQLMKEAEHRAGPEGDNLSVIIMRWGPQAADEPTTVTATMPLGEFQTEMERTVTLENKQGAGRELTDEEIERAIEEIRSTIQRYRK
jgi:serine/threonine protein phosphatase PrpC